MMMRPATQEDIQAYCSLPKSPTIRATAGEIDGKVVFLGGIAFSNGRWYAFVDLEDEARKHKFAVARAAIKFFRKARDSGIRYIYALPDLNEPSSIKWMTSLGFEPDMKTPGLFRWRG